MNNAIAFRTLYKSSGAVLIYRLSTLLCLFMLLDYAYMHITRLDTHDYSQPFLWFAVIQRIGWLAAGAILILAITGLRYGRFWINWSELKNGVALRQFLTLLSSALGIAHAIQGYNFYFSQGYYSDRLLILLLVTLIYWRPVFIFAFLLILLPLLWQWNAPLGGYLWGTIRHILQVLILFCAWFALNACNRHQQSADFIFLSCCLTASVYWIPGLLKLQMDWFSMDQIRYMPLAAYAHGWLTWLDMQQIVSYAKFIAQFEELLHYIVLIFELGALVCLWKRKLLLTLLVFACFFHGAVFALYGYLMWAWIILDIGLILLILRIGPGLHIFTPLRFTLSIILILSANWWLNPPKLAWYNTPLSYTYRYLGSGASGRLYNVPPRFFSPYGDIMTMANFRFLSPEPRLVGPYGITQSQKIVKQLQSAKSAPDVFILEKKSGRTTYNSEQANQYYAFIRDYISHYNDHIQATNYWPGIDCCYTPAQFWSLDPMQAYSGQEAIKKITILEITTLYDNVKLKEIRQRVLNTITIR